MNAIIPLVFILMVSVNTAVIFDFQKRGTLVGWEVVNDGVMGGLSSSTLSLDPNGHGHFQGDVSLKNNGGFSSLRYSLKTRQLVGADRFVLRIKGDGKRYQFRAKSNQRDYYAYVKNFETSGKWEEIEIPFNEMEAAFRGRKLNLPNFYGSHMEEMGLLIANKKEESFSLLIDWIQIR